MYKRFDNTIATDGWDAVFIGSGPGSLMAAAVLARSGQKVIVLEKHYEPGGFTHTFKRKGYEWDVGVHYIGGVHREGSVERKAFDYATSNKLKWAYMDSPYDVAIIDGKRYDFVPGIKDQIALWISYFPEEEEAIRKYWDAVAECCAGSRGFFAERAMPAFMSTLAGGFMKRKYLKYADRTTYDVLREFTDNEHLIEVLCAQLGDYGLVPKESSFAIHAMVVNHYRGGGNYPIGGASRIAELMVETIENHGGAVVLRSGIEEILLEKGKAVGVRIESGEEIRGKRVVSGAGVRNTFLRMWPKDAALPFDVNEAFDKVSPSTGHMCLYLGLNKSDRELDLPKYNYWCYDPYTGDKTPGGRITTAYISFPSAKDPSWPETHPDKATIQCIGLGIWDDVKKWADTEWRHRGDDYEAMKDEFKALMLKILFELHPEIEEHIEWAEVSSPLSTMHFSNYDRGEIYGLEHTPKRFRVKWLRPRTPINGLYLTGQDICTAGIVGALMSGLMTSSAILNKNVIDAILKGNAP